jgi:hypothetical protein
VGSKPKNSLNPGWVDGDLEAASWGHAPKQVKFLTFMSIFFNIVTRGRWLIINFIYFMTTHSCSALAIKPASECENM